jgi:uncharacterized coiled-coil protein SlyX
MIDINDWSLLDKQSLFDYIRYNSYRSERYKLLYVATPKVACTSLKWWFATLEGHAQALRCITDSVESDPDLVIHDSFHRVAPDVTGLKPEALVEALVSASYFRFAVVRNPYKRVFSAWQSKLLLREPCQIGPYLEYDFFHHPIECAEDIAAAFEGFLEHLAANEASSYWDVHWTPQATLLRPDLIDYSKLVKIENAKELGHALAERLGGHIPDPFSNHRTNESLIPYLPELLTARSSELIGTLYGKDFETFGYGKQPPDARETYAAGQFDLAFKAIALIRGRHQRLGERGGQIASLNQVLAERGREIEAYREQAERVVAELHDARMQISHLNQAAAERSGQIANLDQVVAARDRRIASLDQVAAERSGQIDAYRKQAERIVARLDEANTLISRLNEDLAERDRRIARLNEEVTEYVQREVDAGESRLPDGFDPDVYLRLNPDVAAAGLDPKMHYLRHGRREKRPYALPVADVFGDDGAGERRTK